MKHIYTDGSAFFHIDPENGVEKISVDFGLHINRSFLADEDMIVTYGSGEEKRDIEVKAGQVVVTTYNNEAYGPNRIFVIDSKEIVENITAEREYMRKQNQCEDKACDVADMCKRKG